MAEPDENGDFYAVIYHIDNRGYRAYVPPDSGRDAAIQQAKNLILLNKDVDHAEVVLIKSGDNVWDSDEDGTQ